MNLKQQHVVPICGLLRLSLTSLAWSVLLVNIIAIAECNLFSLVHHVLVYHYLVHILSS